MKDATPSEKSKQKALSKLTGIEADKIAKRFRKIGGIEDHGFDFLVDVDIKEDWSPLSFRKDFFKDYLKQNPKIADSFEKFCKSLGKKFPEYKPLFLIEEWRYLLIEFFFMNEIQPDTELSIPRQLIFWDKNNEEKALILKIYVGTEKKDILNFLNIPGNNLSKKFEEIGIKKPKLKTRSRKTNTDSFDLFVRSFDTLQTEEIRKVFSVRYPIEYKKYFMNDTGGERKHIYRVRYELISRYLFHRFGFKSPKGEPYKADYVRSIVEKSIKQKTKLKPGLFKSIP